MNIIAKSFLNASLAYFWKTPDKIKSHMKEAHGNGELIEYHREGEYMFAYITHNAVYVSMRGSNGWGPWINNFNCCDNGDGFHQGWVGVHDCFVKDVFSLVDKNREKRFEFTAHSKGCGPVAFLVRSVRREYGKYIKPILFAVPEYMNENGAAKFRKDKIDIIEVNNPRDVVNKVGIKGFFGVHYGTVITLPNVEYGIWEKMKDWVPFIQHAPSEFADGLSQYFYSVRKMPCEAEYVKKIKKIVHM